MRTLLLYGILLFSLPSWGQPVARFSMDEQSGDAYIVDSVSLRTFPVVNHYQYPERISGVNGHALRLDGHSTWASSQGFTFDSITDQMAIEAWYATEAFSPREASIIHQFDPASGFELSVSPFGEVIFSFFADHQKVTLKSVKRLLPYPWNHVVALADLPRRQARIYVNGELWESRDLQPFNQLNTSGSVTFIGRRSDEQSFDGYLLSVLNGALDELAVHNQIPSESEIKERYQNYAGKTTDLAIDAEARHGSDPFRPRYHPMPVTSWANENYGLIFHQGKYHMFFQKNPNFPSLYFMHWGHLSSTDLVNWKEEKIVLRPSMEFDKFGTWSGSVIRDTQNEPVIFYTGVDGAVAGIGKALPLDQELNGWEKPSANPVFSSPPGGYYHMDFRDPFLWKEQGSYYMMVGSGIQNQGGGLLFSYKSDDLIRWRVIDPVYQRTDVDKTGIFWEMPSLTKLNDTDYLLCVTPVPMPGKKARAIYWVGSFQNDTFTPYDEEPRGFELMDGNLLSPALGTDEHGNIVYSGILPESRNVADQKNAGWRHTFSMVRTIRLLSDKRTLGHTPHPNLCRLRGEHTRVSNRQILQDITENLPEIRGNRKELDFILNIGEASLFEIHLMKNTDGGEVTKLLFNIDSSRIGFDRRSSTFSDAEKTLHEATYHFDRSRPLKVHLYMDHSTLEVFIDQLVVFSGRVYPSSPESDHTDLVVKKGTVRIETLDAWELKRTGDDMGSEVCPPGELPDALFTHGQEINKGRSGMFSAYPVPFKEDLYFSFQLERAGQVEFFLYDIFGRKIVTLTPGFTTAGTHHQRVDTSGAAFRGIKIMIAQMMVDGTDAGRLKLIH